ncbi:MAG TPA: hypothetical protein VHC96_04885, partial [Puia sp.]|nr:hypothetical protein [Puia sp.]
MSEKEQILQLFVEKLSGSISLEEEHVLEERLLSDPVFRREWRQLEEKASKLGMGAFLSELDAEEGLRKLRGMRTAADREARMDIEAPETMARTVAHRGGRIGYRKVMAVAAAVLLVAAGIWLLFPRTEKIADKVKI